MCVGYLQVKVGSNPFYYLKVILLLGKELTAFEVSVQNVQTDDVS